MKREQERKPVIRSMRNNEVRGGEIKMKGVELVITGSSFRKNRINKTKNSVVSLMNHKNRYQGRKADRMAESDAQRKI